MKLISQQLRRIIRKRSGGICEVSNNGRRCIRKATELHHKKFRSRGGDHSEENMMAVCMDHHRRIHDGNEEYLKKYKLFSWEV